MKERKRPDSWKQKIHPVFLEIAALRRDLSSAQDEPETTRRKNAVGRVLRTSAQKRRDILKRPGVLPGRACYQVVDIGYLPPSAKEKEEQVFDWFFFKRNRTPRFHALELENKGDVKAHKQLTRARDEFWRLFNSHGPVPPFKVDLIHSDLLELGLPHGLLKLSAEELADCFDEVCPCGKGHSADGLKKQRARVVKDVEAAFKLSSAYRSAMPARKRFAVYGAEEFVAKPYELRDGMRYVEISRKEAGLEYVIHENGVSDHRIESPGARYNLLCRLPELFFVNSIDEIFLMFFENRRSAESRRRTAK